MPEVRIRLALDAFRLEFCGSRALFERAVEPLLRAAYLREWGAGTASAHASKATGEAPRTPLEPPAGPVFQPSAPERFAQYAAQVGSRAATVDQRIMAFTFYLWNYERQEECSADDVAAFFRTTHEEPPEDLPARLADLEQAKRFLEAGGTPGTRRLTSKGVNYVKNRLLASA